MENGNNKDKKISAKLVGQIYNQRIEGIFDSCKLSQDDKQPGVMLLTMKKIRFDITIYFLDIFTR